MKKKLLFTAYNLDLGGIENSLINLLKNIDYDKYEVTLILEKKEGIFLNELNKNVIVKEIKVSNCKIVPLRKIINGFRKFKFKLFNKNKYDFSCCYATYSYSGNVIALTGSTNSMLYVHSNYVDLYKKNESKIREFFDTRNIDKFKYITFVSNESKKDFLNYYKEYSDKSIVFNNFIDVERINNLSKVSIDEKKPNGLLFVFVGRLDDFSKKLGRAINLIKNIDNSTLWIIGDGPDRIMYEKIVDDLNLEKRVIFLGKKKNPYPYMDLADYILLTSDYEGFPVVYLESLILNKDIITTIPVSDDQIDIKKYASIISKDEDKMVKEVKEILKNNKKSNTISIEDIQDKRIKDLEKIFDNEE